jgi:hypothetical protein
MLHVTWSPDFLFQQFLNHGKYYIINFVKLEKIIFVMKVRIKNLEGNIVLNIEI